MPEGSKPHSAPLRLLVISLAGLLLSIGLCGAGAAMPKAGFLVGVGIFVLVLSVLSFLVALIWLPFSR